MEAENEKKILVVEDDPFISDIYVMELENQGYKVSVVNDGEEATDILRNNYFEVILLDIIMPKKDGMTVLSEIKANPSLTKIPVLILSNLGRKETMKKALDLGAEDYIIKTQFTPQEVVKKVKSIIENKNS